MTQVSRDRYEGCLIGAAVGDALGAPLEFRTRDEIAGTYGRVTDFVKALPDHPNNYLMPGQYTDDTQLTIALAETIVENKGFDQKDFASRLARLDRRGDIRSAGKATREACKALSKGKLPPHRCGVPNAIGNGTAMRASPLGLFYSMGQQLSGEFKQACYESTVLTHNSSGAVAGTAAIARSVLYLKKAEGRFNQADFLDNLIRFTKYAEISDEKRRSYSLKDNLTSRLEKLVRLRDLSFVSGAKEIGNNSTVLESVPLAIFAFLKSSDDFERTVENAANFGGDADTIASMAGALSGAYNGLGKIPEKYWHNLESFGLIKSLANQIFDAALEKGHIRTMSQGGKKLVYVC